MSSHLQTHLTTSAFNALCHFSGTKKPHKAGSFKCPCLLFASRYSFAKSLPELKQFMCKNARTFLKLHQPFHQFISANNKPTIGSRQFQP
ncbi:hypothetical protein SDY_1993 [Shigella dysenteriae Sd197]|uniref:Uncharacterized protein n=2 Tax=Shigella dysenteriae TaxID=622 RepID=Q32F13_SHIDS|nr:hypothetical protein SDY_1993 [Shigella dysenteriae Sd197]AHA65509.1 hypothetical protein Asd1617_02682 [Shigella dysenteriae 1617]